MASRSRIGISKSRIQSSKSKIFGTSKSKIISQSSSTINPTRGKAIFIDGINVTPRSLFATKIIIPSKKLKKNKVKVQINDPNQSSSTIVNSVASSASIASSTITRSDNGQKMNTSNETSEEPKELVTGKYILSMKEKTFSRMKHLDDMYSNAINQAADKSSFKSDIQNQPGTKIATIKIKETKTHILFSMSSVCVSLDSPEHDEVDTNNKTYIKKCQNKLTHEQFNDQRVQTLNFCQKNKEVMATPPATRDAECMVNNWDIFDSHKVDADMNTNYHNEASASLDTEKIQNSEKDNHTPLTRHVNELVQANLASPGCLLQVDSDIKEALQNNISATTVYDLSIQRGDGYSHQPENKDNKSGHSRMLSRSNIGKSSSRINIGTSSSRINIGASTSRVNIGSSTSRVNMKNSRKVINTGKSNASVASRVSTYSGSSSKKFSQIGLSQDVSGANDERAPKVAPIELKTIIAYREADKIMKNLNLNDHLSTVERAIQQNIYHHRQLLYRNYPFIEENLLSLIKQTENSSQDDQSSNVDPNSPNGESCDLKEEIITENTSLQIKNDRETKLLPLWSFSCDLTVGRTVSCMAWNIAIEDLLAVSYSSFEFNNNQDGLVLLWSLKNPEYPQQIFRTNCGVTSIEFSSLHPNLLAVGQYNGVVAIYDMNKKNESYPILESCQGKGSHIDAVWQVKWINKGNERGENLVSISSDGRVTEWSMKKGLSFTDLMIIKRVSNGKGQADGIISRQASGLCFDFANSDSSVYYAGTEDGVIHKCSCSYNEQYLQTYFGHSGPIYRLKLSPFWSDIFISCSADWTVKLWHQTETSELVTFHSIDLAHAVFDVAWSPNEPTIFGSVTEDGRIEIWDLDKSTLDPVVRHYQKSKEDELPVQCTNIIFAASAPVIAVGDNHGQVIVYQIPRLANQKCYETREDISPIEKIKRALYTESGNPSSHS